MTIRLQSNHLTHADRVKSPPRAAPLIPIVVAVGLGIVLDREFDPCSTSHWTGLSLVSALLTILLWNRKISATVALLCALVAFGGAWHHQAWSDRAPHDLAALNLKGPTLNWLRGVVLTTPEHFPGLYGFGEEDQGYTRFEMEVEQSSDGSQWWFATGRLQVTVGGDRTDLHAGDPIEAAGTLKPIEGPLNPGTSDARVYPRSRGIVYRFSIDDPESVLRHEAGTPRPILRWINQIRTDAENRIDHLYDDQAAPLIAALLLGRRGRLSESTKDAFSRTGTAHLLAISGLHLGGIALGVGLLARWMGYSPKPIAVLIIVASIGYASMVGWRPSVGRSTTMIVAASLAVLVDREKRMINLLAMAALVTMVVDPTSPYNLGWQLSMLSVGALILGPQPIARLLKKWTEPTHPLDRLERRLQPPWQRMIRRIFSLQVSLLIASTVVWGVCLPLLIHHFGVISPIGVLLNLAMIPMVSLVVALGGVVLLLSVISPALAAPFAKACGWLIQGTEAIALWGAEVPGGHFFLPSPPVELIIGFYLALALGVWASYGSWSWPIRRTLQASPVLIGIVGAVLVFLPHKPREPEVQIYAVGHGLSVGIFGPDGTAALYDCGKSHDPSVGRRILAPAFWSRGIRRIEAVVLSHADSDHYNGVLDLLDRFEIGSIYLPEGFGGPDNPSAVGLLNYAKRLGIPINTVVAGDRLPLVAEIEATVLHPPAGWLPSAPDNDRSLVIDLANKDHHLLLTGDLDGTGTVEFAGGPTREIDAMLAPHHGGRSANPSWFDDWARPSIVVASQQRPREGTLDSFAAPRARGAAVYQTWRDGAVLLRWSQDGFLVQTWKESAQ